MKQVVQITLDDNDRDLLAGKMPMPSERLRIKRKDMSYCGCPEEYELTAAQKPYKDAGIYDYMLVKMNLIEAVRDLNVSNMRLAIKDFEKLPTEVKDAMHLDVSDVEYWLCTGESLQEAFRSK